jgi:hypothetical protein
VNVLQSIIARNGQAKLILKLPVTAVDAGDDPIQDLAILNLTGHAGRNYRIKGGIVDTPAVDLR